MQQVANGGQPQKMRSYFARNHTQHAHTILDEVLDQSPGVTWNDIAGLEVAKQILQVPRSDLLTEARLCAQARSNGRCYRSPCSTLTCRAVHGKMWRRRL